jgi:pyruvate dehydrogenase E2 component (dihydrolipoamide acetyltransferase)
MADIQMPQLGETVTEGTITKWFKNVGDQVTEDEPLFEVSTDKVDSEVPSPVSGVLSEILVPEGDTVDVGVVLARVGDAPAAGGEAAPAAGGEAAPADAGQEAAPAPAPAAEGAPASNGRLLSPVVRRLISENSLDPAAIQGTGPGGRITRNDVLKALDEGAAAAAAAPAAPAPAPAPATQPAPAAAAPAAAAPAPVAAAPRPQPRAGERDTSIPHTNIRRRTAEHMTRSLATSAHVYASIEVDFEGVDRVRAAQREAFKAQEGFSLTYLPFISRAVVDAIREFPEVNASFGENELVVHNYVNLGIAVDLDFKGLMVPVIHDADGKRLRALAREINDLARRARSKQLGPDDIAGGTFTITNPGPYGTTMTLPIINQPQVAIVSTDGVKRRPVVVDLPDGSEGIAIHSTGNITLTWDHRAFDGAYAAALLRQVKDILESRDWAAELA